MGWWPRHGWREREGGGGWGGVGVMAGVGPTTAAMYSERLGGALTVMAVVVPCRRDKFRRPGHRGAAQPGRAGLRARRRPPALPRRRRCAGPPARQLARSVMGRGGEGEECMGGVSTARAAAPQTPTAWPRHGVADGHGRSAARSLPPTAGCGGGRCGWRPRTVLDGPPAACMRGGGGGGGSGWRRWWWWRHPRGVRGWHGRRGGTRIPAEG